VLFSVEQETVSTLFAALPYGLQFTSQPVSHYGNQYAVQWVVSSYSPLVDFILSLKQVTPRLCHTSFMDSEVFKTNG